MFASFDDAPIGSASIGQIHAATLRDRRETSANVEKPAVEGLLLCEPLPPYLQLNGNGTRRFVHLAGRERSGDGVRPRRYVQAMLDEHAGRFRAPNRTIADTREFWAAGRPRYDPATIRCPVLLIHGALDREWPRETAPAYYAKLSGTARRRRHEIADGTHSLLIERCRDRIAAEIARFVVDFD